MNRKLKYSLISAVAILALSSTASAATTDSEGMPVVYLRGEFGHSYWGVDDDYKFNRNGNTYTLAINGDNPVPEGKFKIGDEEWNFDFGGDRDNIYIDQTSSLTLARQGANLRTHGIYSGSISFEFTGYDNCVANFVIEADSPDLSQLISGTLPVMYINVYKDDSKKEFNDEINDYYLSHKDYFNDSEYWIDLNGCEWMADLGAESVGSEEEPLPLQIKARGNWTRIGFSKKPFKLKLDKKQNLLGLTPEKSKHYALLAHADDTNGYMRNFTSFNLGERIGLPWSPGMQPVELVVNGDYRGLYFLTESIRVGDGRIEIEELEDNATEPDLISGGYIVELDNYDEDNQIRMDEKACVDWQHLDKLRITWDTPENYSDLQKKFVTDQFTAINNAIGANKDDTWSYLDLDMAARYYLVNEIIGHTEAYHGSTYLYRDRGEDQKWVFSPLWDAGNAFRGKTDEFFYNCDPFGNTWIPSMRENRMFNDKVKETWLWFMQNEYDGIEEDLDDFASHISSAVKYDRRRWANEPHPDGGQGVADNSDIQSRLKEVKNILRAKVEWLKGRFGNYMAGTYSEPERDLTPAAPLPDYAQAGIEDLWQDTDAPAELYNLQGVRVINPVKGQIYIMRKGTQSRKIVWFGDSSDFH